MFVGVTFLCSLLSISISICVVVVAAHDQSVFHPSSSSSRSSSFSSRISFSSAVAISHSLQKLIDELGEVGVELDELVRLREMDQDNYLSAASFPSSSSSPITVDQDFDFNSNSDVDPQLVAEVLPKTEGEPAQSWKHSNARFDPKKREDERLDELITKEYERNEKELARQPAAKGVHLDPNDPAKLWKYYYPDPKEREHALQKRNEKDRARKPAQLVAEGKAAE